MNLLYLHREKVPFHGHCHVMPPCFRMLHSANSPIDAAKPFTFLYAVLSNLFVEKIHTGSKMFTGTYLKSGKSFQTSVQKLLNKLIKNKNQLAHV